MGTALVTGASGFTGRHFTRHLREHGWKVWAIDTRPSGWLSDQQDAVDFFRCPRGPSGFDLVLHCAEVGGSNLAGCDPLGPAVNLEIDVALFRWARSARPGRLVYFSSAAVYPVRSQKKTGNVAHQLNETEAMSGDLAGLPDGLYGWAKLTGEYLVCKAWEDGLAVSVVRPFCRYGEDQSGGHLVPSFADRALRREDPFLVPGTGDQVRDFIHVDDMVSAVMTMYALDYTGPVNLATGRAMPLKLLAVMVCEQAGYRPQFECVPSVPSGVDCQVAHNFRVGQLCRPRVSLEDGIARVLEYRRRFLTD